MEDVDEKFLPNHIFTKPKEQTTIDFGFGPDDEKKPDIM